MKKNIPLLYGFSFFDQFMIVIAVWVPYLAMKGIGMRQFMELQAVFALVILCGELPSGVLSDLWGRKKTLSLGSTLKAVSFSLLPLWSSYEGFLFYHLTMGIALSMISGGDVALLYDSLLTAGGEKSRGTAILGNAKLAAQTGTTGGALGGGGVVTPSYGHLLWGHPLLSRLPRLWGARDTAGGLCSPRPARCPSSRISGWRLSSVGAGYCSGPWARSAGAWAGCSSWRRSTRGSPPRSARP